MNPAYLWALDHPWPTAAAAAVTVLVLAGTAWAIVRTFRGIDRPPAAVIAASIAAAGCTAYSADTSWGFARDHLGMTSAVERGAMFAAAEVALVATALMARQNLRESGAPGVPGILVWVITGVQIVPAYAESGFVGGTVRAFVGPVLAALLWHLAMGIELRHATPGADSQSLPALIARELRERLLSRLGLAVRDRTAEQITRDRWTTKAVDLAARLSHRDGGWEWRTARLERRLSRAVGRAQVGAHPQQRRALLQLLSARLHSGALATLDLPSPWEMRKPVSPPRPAPVVAYEQLRDIAPMDAILVAASAHPNLPPGELREVLADHGVIVTETQVSIALRAGASVHPPALTGAFPAGQRLYKVHARWDGEGASDALDDAPDAGESDADAAADRALLPDARRVEQAHIATHGRPASLRALQRGLRIGQQRAQRMRALLDEPDEGMQP